MFASPGVGILRKARTDDPQAATIHGDVDEVVGC